MKSRHHAISIIGGVGPVGTLLWFTHAAKADVIDGEWCDETGRHLSIMSPTIMTPSGKETQGQYTRHSFRYTAPSSEAASGQDISMQLMTR